MAVDIKNKAISQPRRASIWCVGPPTLEMSGGIAAIAGTQKKAWRPPTPDVYTYIGVVAEVSNEGLPRAAWNIIGEQKS